MTDGREEKNIIFGFNLIVLLCILMVEKKIILFRGEGLTQVLDNATITAEAKYPINFTEYPINFVKFAL